MILLLDTTTNNNSSSSSSSSRDLCLHTAGSTTAPRSAARAEDFVVLVSVR